MEPGGDFSRNHTLKIAIVGVGLAGAAAAFFLKSVPNIEVQLYERSKVHRKIGAWLGLTPTAQNLLEQICGEDSVESICARTYGKPVKRHWRTGEILFQPEPVPDSLTKTEKQRLRATANTVRQDVHRILLDEIPREQIHMGMKAVDFSVHDGKVTVLFEDNGPVEADLLIVSDGINSLRIIDHMKKLRAKIYPDIKPRHLPCLQYIETFDKADLIAAIPNLSDGVTHFINGDMLAFVGDMLMGSSRARIARVLSYAYQLTLTRLDAEAGLKEQGLEGRLLGPSSYLQVLDHSKNMGVFPISREIWLESLITQGSVCFVGDSAHPTGAALGAGCSFAFEDSKTLGLSLSYAHTVAKRWSPKTVRFALDLYDEARRSHLRKVFRLLEREDLSYSGMMKDEATQEDERREKVKGTSWLTNFDPDVDFAAACARLSKSHNF
ncbi:hypothetical protein MGYG_03468 [Nannizzia gypsea CBS 118893]|uniref:FAD-binding domain-containing protein n=1 Tax=Arthroderma gypseum (strain ATCC MYA-4604 / CBS 118893) TaxID=535722 RepID=E4US48_ARTGP|nr:hypothetical protein MGYG_03468 [Nannizzia gypsea CBS 118893]EFR00466.1 hypothetical protein MGYG_03468 [Nannizzia gypsea CBS 118893]